MTIATYTAALAAAVCFGGILLARRWPERTLWSILGGLACAAMLDSLTRGF